MRKDRHERLSPSTLARLEAGRYGRLEACRYTCCPHVAGASFPPRGRLSFPRSSAVRNLRSGRHPACRSRRHPCRPASCESISVSASPLPPSPGWKPGATAGWKPAATHAAPTSPERPSTVEPYPRTSPERDRWILKRRGPRSISDVRQPQFFFVETERGESGDLRDVLTILLTSRECPWRCLMCDLWRQTVEEPIPGGAVPAQIDHALFKFMATHEPTTPFPRQIKLYNAGSFFDPHALPPGDYDEVARRLRSFDRVVVECHPALVGDRCLAFRNRLAAWPPTPSASEIRGPRLEVAMGLETIHPEVLDRLNKRMTLSQFSVAAAFLRQNGIALRAFVLVQPPFLDETEGLVWAQKSVEFAFDCGASAVTLIPTRPGNGALDALAQLGQFTPPRLSTLERAVESGIRLNRGRVFADTWDLEQFSECPECFPARAARLSQMNLQQQIPHPITCQACGTSPKARPGLIATYDK